MNTYSSLLNLDQYVAIVTGGGNGIGAASCKLLAQHGASVVVADLKLDAAQKIVDEIKAQGFQAIAVECNVLNDEDLVRLVETTVNHYHKINILVNNAGGGGAGRESPEHLSVEQFARTFQLNVFSGWRLSQLCAPYM